MARLPWFGGVLLGCLLASGVARGEVVAIPASLDLGSELVGSSGGFVTVGFYVAGPAPVTFSAVTITGMGGASFELMAVGALPVTVPPGGNVDYPVRFAPLIDGLQSAALEVTTDDPVTPLVAVPLQGFGVADVFVVTPLTLSLGPVAVDTSADGLVQVSNAGAALAFVLDIVLLPGSDPAFSLDDLPLMYPAPVAGGSSFDLQVFFRPSAPGVHLATLELTTSDPLSPVWVVAITGEAARVRGVVEPTSVPFGRVEVGSTSEAVTVEVRNEEPIPLVLDLPAMRAGSDPGFTVTFDPTQAALEPGASVTVDASFAPATPGLHVATLELTSLGSDTPFASVALVGEGVSPTEEVPDIRGGRCAVLAFGNTRQRSGRGVALAMLSLIGLMFVRRRTARLMRVEKMRMPWVDCLCVLALATLVTTGCGPKPEPLNLPADPAAAGVPIGVTTVVYQDVTFDVWYPAPDDVAGMASDSVDLGLFIPEAFVAAVDPFVAPIIALGAVRDAPLRVPEDPYPVVLFSHGLGGFRYQSVDYVAHVASRGYVVIGVDHPGRMLADVLPCVFEPVLEGCNLGGVFSDPAPPHLELVLDWILAANEEGLFEDALDTTRIGMSGHSMGAGSTATLSTDTRLAALLMLAGGGEVMGDSPALVMGGTCDAFATEDSLAEIPVASPSVELVQILRAGHLAYSDLCELELGMFAEDLLVGRPDLNPIFWDLLSALATDGCPGGEPMDPPADCLTEPYLDLNVSRPIIRYYATVFFDAALRGTGPGVEDGVFPEAELR